MQRFKNGVLDLGYDQGEYKLGITNERKQNFYKSMESKTNNEKNIGGVDTTLTLSAVTC